MIYFRCSACDESHLSEFQMDKRVFERTVVYSRTEVCPMTGKAVTYDKGRMYWQDPPPKSRIRRPRR